jgi:two-component system cell cycle sensor histidine kinase/response regulator CckA
MLPFWHILPWILLAIGAAAFAVVERRHRRALESSSLGLQRILQAVESATEAIGIGDFEGNSLYHNRAHKDLFGYSVEELNALPGSGVLFADKATAKAIFACIFAGKSWSGEADIVTKAGRRLAAYVRADVIRDARGVPVGIFGLFRDVTRERQLADEAARASKLESLGLMAGGIAHDFSNLLTVMLGQILMAEMEPFSQEAVSESLVEIKKVTLRAQGLTNQLRSFAKGEIPSMALIELQPLLGEAVNLALKGSVVRPALSLPATLPAVMADSTQMLQVFHNLALNAVQAMPGGGTLTVTAGILPEEEAQFLALEDLCWVRVSVIDTGVGIPPEALTRIFEPFFTTKPKGTGLGLATCYTIVKRHGGHLKAESTPGRGTTFQVLLPASTLKPEAPA